MTDPVLSVRSISKSFGALKASDGVSIDLLPGEIHALIGPNGAGKSTLISQIAGGLKPDSGSVEFLGQDVTTLGTASRARMGLARSFQVSSVVPDFTVLQNVVLAVQGATGHWIGFLRSVLADADLTKAAAGFIHQVGLSARKAVHAADLAHGERRKLEIAMALALSPKAFLLDEPMAGLGVEGTSEMTKLLDQLRHKAPILLVEHDMDTVFKLADRISVLVYGRIIATGSVDEIRSNPDVQRAYLGEETLS